MRPFLLCTCLVLVSVLSHSQPFDWSLYQAEEAPCPNDPTTTRILVKNVDLFQTINNEFDGEVDSSLCPSFKDAGFSSIIIDFETFDPSRPLFMKLMVDSARSNELFPNSLLSVNYWVQCENVLLSNCTEDRCSKILVSIEIPSEDGSEMVQRIHEAEIEPELNAENFIECIPVEYFDENLLESVTIQMYFDSIGQDPIFNFSFLPELNFIIISSIPNNTSSDSFEFISFKNTIFFFFII